MEKEKSMRNITLDMFKLIAAFMVVFIHVGFGGNVGVVINALARFAVPLFFFTSGFFSYKNDTKKIKAKIKKILILYLIALIVYLLYQVIFLLVYGDSTSLTTYFKSVFTLKDILYFLVFNYTQIGGHLWFLLALLYVYIIWFIVVKFSVNKKLILILTICSLVAHLILGEVLGAFGIIVPIEYVRNFALMGFPFFALGFFANVNREKIASIKTIYAIIALVFGVAETILSRYFFVANEIYVGSLGIVFFMVVISLKHSEKRYPKILKRLTTTTTDIYIFHLVISWLGIGLFSRLGLHMNNGIFSKIWPFAVIVFSVIFSLILDVIKKFIKTKKK